MCHWGQFGLMFVSEHIGNVSGPELAVVSAVRGGFWMMARNPFAQTRWPAANASSSPEVQT